LKVGITPALKGAENEFEMKISNGNQAYISQFTLSIEKDCFDTPCGRFSQ